MTESIQDTSPRIHSESRLRTGEIKNLYPMKLAPRIYPWGQGFNLKSKISNLKSIDPVDTDNIIKPIQDALIGLVYEDDSLVTDVEDHRRSLSDTFDVALCASLLLRGIISGSECVYVRINSAKALESYL